MNRVVNMAPSLHFKSIVVRSYSYDSVAVQMRVLDGMWGRGVYRGPRIALVIVLELSVGVLNRCVDCGCDTGL